MYIFKAMISYIILVIKENKKQSTVFEIGTIYCIFATLRSFLRK